MTENQLTHHDIDTTPLMALGPNGAEIPTHLSQNSLVDTSISPGISSSEETELPAPNLSKSQENLSVVKRSGDVIPDRIINGLHDRDAHVTGRIEQSRSNIVNGILGAQKDNAYQEHMSNDAIIAAEIFFHDEYEKAQQTAKLLIASIEEQLEIKKWTLLGISTPIIAEHERVVENIKAESNEATKVALIVDNFLDGLEALQLENTRDRDAAILDIDTLDIRRDDCIKDMNVQRSLLDEAIRARFESEEEKVLLFERKRRLNRMLEIQRAKDLQPFRNVIINEIKHPKDSDEFKDALSDSLEEYERLGILNGYFPLLKAAHGELDTWKDEEKSNITAFKAATRTIGIQTAKIKEIDDELSLIPIKIAKAQERFAHEAGLVASDLDTRATAGIFATDVFAAISRGDLDVVGEKPLPSAMVKFLDAKILTMRAASIANGMDPMNEWNTSAFEINEDLVFQLSGNPNSVQEGLERVNTVSEAERTFAMISVGSAKDISDKARDVGDNVRGFGAAVLDKIRQPRITRKYQRTIK